MRVDSVMSFPVYVCSPGDTVAAAAASMSAHGCGALPVVDETGCPIGILTDRDICLAIGKRVLPPASIVVRSVMTSDPFTCNASDSVEQALRLMTSCRVRRLPVVDTKGVIVGVLSITDVLEALRDAPDLDIPLLRRSFASVCKLSRPRRQGVPTAIPIESGALSSSAGLSG